MPTVAPSPQSAPLPAAVQQAQAMAAALTAGRFFKLIAGGSFTDGEKVHALVDLYARAGVDAVDVAPDPPVVEAAIRALDTLPEGVQKPLLMVSLDLDGDPHFRKVALLEEACIHCDACVPVCPTEALISTGGGAAGDLSVVDPLCYGCGRCVEVCPTEALAYRPLEMLAEPLQAVLEKPQVAAVELHTQTLEVATLERFLAQTGPWLAGKWISLCFRPQATPYPQEEAFLACLEAFVAQESPYPLLIQVDGRPMGGDRADRDGARPALEAAQTLRQRYPGRWPWITLSGGINQHTAETLKQPSYGFIAGVGMGTVARQWVWDALSHKNEDATALQAAYSLVQRFKNREKSPIIEASAEIPAKILIGVCNESVSSS